MIKYLVEGHLFVLIRNLTSDLPLWIPATVPCDVREEITQRESRQVEFMGGG